MSSFTNLAGAAAHFASVARDTGRANKAIMTAACKMVAAEAKRVIGTYDYGWSELAESTQEERARKGYAPNDPLLRKRRTGVIGESVPNPTLRIVPEPCRGFWDGDEFMGGVSEGIFGRFRRTRT